MRKARAKEQKKIIDYLKIKKKVFRDVDLLVLLGYKNTPSNKTRMWQWKTGRNILPAVFIDEYNKLKGNK